MIKKISAIKLPSFLQTFLAFIAFVFTTVFTFISKVIKKVEKLLTKTKSTIIFLACYSLFINLLLEAAMRRDLFEAFLLIFKSPLMFLFNALIVFATFSLMFLFKRRFFVFVLFSFVWYIIAGVSLFLMFTRATPFNCMDFRNLASCIEIIPNYLSVFQIFLLILAIVAVFALIVFAFIKSKKIGGITKLSAITAPISCVLCVACWIITSNFVVATDRFDNLPNAFNQYGFAYCFLYSMIDYGIPAPEGYNSPDAESLACFILSDDNKKIKNSKPEIASNHEDDDFYRRLHTVVSDNLTEYSTNVYYNYTEDYINEQLDEIDLFDMEKQKELYDNASSVNEVPYKQYLDSEFDESFDMPNVIFLQLESFYDLNNISGFSYAPSMCPHPIYSSLKESLPGGKLSVPSIGAGTANTEFEILTGMDVSYFGIAEYPYLSFLQSNACESMAYNSKLHGYSTHVIHNHKASFYDRSIVFPNLGFDSFTPIENTPVIYKNKYGWAKDLILIDPIMEALDSTEGQDFIYAISVQAHGKYPSQSDYDLILEGKQPKISVSSTTPNPELPGFTYYVNEINDVDTFIGALILQLEARYDEPTVLVMYGDHLPAFSAQDLWELKEGDFYQTDYIIWNNCGIDFSDAKDLETYQLGAYIFSKLGITDGLFNRFNQMHFDDNDCEECLNDRHTLQYAVTQDEAFRSGEHFINYEPVNTKPGIYDNAVENIYVINDYTYVKGTNFNEYTKVLINDKKISTEYINGSVVRVKRIPDAGDTITTHQIASNGTLMSEGVNTMTFTTDMVVSTANISKTLNMLMTLNSANSSTVVKDATVEFLVREEELDGLSAFEDGSSDPTIDFLMGKDTATEEESESESEQEQEQAASDDDNQ